jgi:hypothetical protein
MWKEKDGWIDDDKREYARKWRSWRFADGQWSKANDGLVESLSREQMITEYGGYTDAPMLSTSRQDGESSRDIAVYSLDHRTFTDEERQQLRDFKSEGESKKDIDEYIEFADKWEEDHPDLAWLNTWESVYPSAYIVFVDYMVADDTIETHHIYCHTYPDMLEVLRLHA